MLLDFFEMVLYFTNTGVRKVVVNRNAIPIPGHGRGRRGDGGGRGGLVSQYSSRYINVLKVHVDELILDIYLSSGVKLSRCTISLNGTSVAIWLKYFAQRSLLSNPGDPSLDLRTFRSRP